LRRPERSDSVPGEGRAAAADGYTINDGDNETHCLAVVTQDHGYGHIAASASSAPASRRGSPEWANAMTGGNGHSACLSRDRVDGVPFLSLHPSHDNPVTLSAVSSHTQNEHEKKPCWPSPLLRPFL